MQDTWTTKPAGRHTCECGAVYEKSIVRKPLRETDRIYCGVCSAEMDSWSSVFVPTYQRVEHATA